MSHCELRSSDSIMGSWHRDVEVLALALEVRLLDAPLPSLRGPETISTKWHRRRHPLAKQNIVAGLLTSVRLTMELHTTSCLQRQPGSVTRRTNAYDAFQCGDKGQMACRNVDNVIKTAMPGSRQSSQPLARS
jgi:hypothetical protein